MRAAILALVAANFLATLAVTRRNDLRVIGRDVDNLHSRVDSVVAVIDSLHADPVGTASEPDASPASR